MNYNQEGQPIIEIPGVEVDTEFGPLVLSWVNTVLRTYKEEMYNHVEYTNDDGDKIGFLTPESVMEVLLEREFPYSYQPLTDSQTLDWYIGIQAEQLDTELSELE